MRAAIAILFLTALLTGSAVARSETSPCDVVTQQDLRDVLRGKALAPDPSTIGEETAPSCIWDGPGAKARVKIEIWSGDELKVVDEDSAANYFARRRGETLQSGGARLFSLGGAAYRTAFGAEATGEIGVLFGKQYIVFNFEHVPYRRALAFAKAVVRKL